MARTTIDLDDKLLEEAMRTSKESTKKGVIEEALRERVNRRKRELFLELAGSGAVDMTLEELQAWRRMGTPRVEPDVSS